jgi:hypothetical protein
MKEVLYQPSLNTYAGSCEIAYAQQQIPHTSIQHFKTCILKWSGYNVQLR